MTNVSDNALSPRVSPDGKRLVYTRRDDAGNNSAIYRRDVGDLAGDSEGKISADNSENYGNPDVH
jgi:Tol biopolymer transport system component